MTLKPMACHWNKWRGEEIHSYREICTNGMTLERMIWKFLFLDASFCIHRFFSLALLKWRFGGLAQFCHISLSASWLFNNACMFILILSELIMCLDFPRIWSTWCLDNLIKVWCYVHTWVSWALWWIKKIEIKVNFV